MTTNTKANAKAKKMGNSHAQTTSHWTGSESERLGAVESDIGHLDQRITTLSMEVRDGFASLRKLYEMQRQPITAFAGWAAIVLTLVGAVLYPQIKTDERLESAFVELTRHYAEHIKDGHPKTVLSRVDSNAANILRLDSDIQRRLEERWDMLMANDNEIREDLKQVSATRYTMEMAREDQQETQRQILELVERVAELRAGGH